MSISVIIPVLNDTQALQAILPRLRDARVETIVVDGGSTPPPKEIVSEFGAILVDSKPGRARQMNAGAGCATGDQMLFLHADSELPDHFTSLIEEAVALGYEWGRFDIKLSGNHFMFPLIAWMMNQRSRLTGICTGDQGIFITRRLFESLGGFADIPLMEDIEICKRLEPAPYCIRQKLVTSSRRWEKNGVFNTIWLMWRIRLRYFFGESPESLVKQYYP